MKTDDEIQAEITALQDIRPRVRPRSAFGDDNIAKLDAQVAVLQNHLDTRKIYDTFEHDDEALMAALDARQWLDGESDIEHLAEDWPLREESAIAEME